MCDVKILFDGYSLMKNEQEMNANCTCTLIRGVHDIIVDTMTPWDSNKILNGDEYVINDNVKVIPTPGHTLTDVTVIVTNAGKETIAITGDLFEKYEDIENPDIWLDAGSEDPVQQRKNRSKIANLADWIVPGHGPKFKVTDNIRQTLATQINT